MSLDNTKFYKSSYDKYGVSARGVNWNDDFSQIVRFEVISDLLRDELKSSKIVDAGCGFGELYAYWQKCGTSPLEYVGLDCMQNSVDISTERFGDSLKCSFTCRDVLRDDLPVADWYVSSGALNILNSFETWLFLEKMLKFSKKGIVFNVLQGYIKSKNFNYQTKEDIKEFARRKDLECFIVEGYMKNDMTVRILK